MVRSLITWYWYQLSLDMVWLLSFFVYLVDWMLSSDAKQEMCIIILIFLVCQDSSIICFPLSGSAVWIISLSKSLHISIELQNDIINLHSKASEWDRAFFSAHFFLLSNFIMNKQNNMILVIALLYSSQMSMLRDQKCWRIFFRSSIFPAASLIFIGLFLWSKAITQHNIEVVTTFLWYLLLKHILYVIKFKPKISYAEYADMGFSRQDLQSFGM